MRVQVLIAASDCIPEREFATLTSSTPRTILSSVLNHEVSDALTSNDVVVIYSRPKDIHIEYLLSNNLKLAHAMAAVLKSCCGQSCDVALKLFQTQGYMLRLVGFADLLRQVVNNVEDLKGTTVIADIM